MKYLARHKLIAHKESIYLHDYAKSARNMEGDRGVGKAKEHDRGFEEAFGHKKGSFPFIPWLNLDIVVPPSDIKLSEEGAAAEAVNGLGNEGGDVAVLFGPLIDGVIVLNRAEFPILLFYKEEIGSIRAPGFSDHPSFKVFSHKLVGLSYFVLF